MFTPACTPLPLHYVVRSFAIYQVQPIDPVSRCQQRKGRYAGFDPVCWEKLVLRSPLGIGNDHVLGDQLDVDGCEIKLKIASYVDLPFKIGRNDGLERVLQEPSLGDKQYRPDKNDQRQQACNNSDRKSTRLNSSH